jgi:hypothetical protein
MGLLDVVANRSFRDDQAGRLVVLGGALRNRGFLVKSKTEELKIRSFVKMFGFAEISIQLLGTLLATAWMSTFSYTSGRRSEQVLRAFCIYLGTYVLVAGLPLWLLWMSYRREFFRCVSTEDEVLVMGKAVNNQRSFQALWVMAIGLLILMGVVFILVRFK